jgi:O-methyltransferase domain
MKGVIHDWNDADAITLLINCRNAILPHGKLLIHTELLKASDTANQGNFMDIFMMLYGGRERTEDELSTLTRQAFL